MNRCRWAFEIRYGDK